MEAARTDAPTTAPRRDTAGSSGTALQRVVRTHAIRRAIWRAAVRTKVDPQLAISVADVESHFDHGKVSPAGARGVMQLMPPTAAGLNVDPGNLKQNIRGGVTYLRQLLDRFAGDEALAVAAYNAGPTRVIRAGGVPNVAETQAHVAKVSARKLLFRLTLPLSPARPWDPQPRHSGST
jgi:soluble lytic murein transglycosylase-like protein